MAIDFLPSLETERLLLEKPEKSFEFAIKMFSVVDANREHILPWMDWAMPEITRRAEDDYNFALDADRAWKAGERFEYAIYKKTDKEFLGGVAVIKKGRTVDKQFELAYWLKKDACKKGYMQEAVRALENMLFSSGAERLVIRNDVDNLNSVKVAQNLGYQLEGIERNGRFSECLQKLTDINVFSKIK